MNTSKFVQDGATALIVAAANGYMECVRLLVESGANMEATTKVHVILLAQGFFAC